MRKWLRTLRKERGFSQHELARQAGISQTYYAGIELGSRCKADKVRAERRIAEVLDFDWTRFFEGEGSERGYEDTGI